MEFCYTTSCSFDVNKHNSVLPSQPTSPNGGNYFDFYPLSEASDTLYQMIDIADISTDVDSGYIVCDLRGYLKKLRADSSDTIKLEMLDIDNRVLSSYELTEDSVDNSDDWVYKAMIDIPVNANTRKFRISLNASISNISPDTDYIEFDDIELKLKQVPANLTLYKQVGRREQTKVTETNEKISISLEIPEVFWNTDVTKSREFYVIRIHDGEITRIDGSYDAIKQIFTFETDRFSTYALTYQDINRLTTYEGFRYLQLR